MKPHIVLIGTGYTSVWAVKYLERKLGKSLRRGEIKVTFVSDVPHHSFHGFTGEYVTGYLPMRYRDTDIRELFPYANFIHGRFQEIDQQKDAIIYLDLASGKKRSLTFDQLVIGIGSGDKPVFTEHAHSVKKPKGVVKTREAVIEAISKAERSGDPAEIDKLLHFVVLGGGIAGVEVASNLREQFRSLEESYQVLKAHPPRITVVHSGREIMPQIKMKLLIRYAKKCLQRQQVDLILNTHATGVTPSGVQLSNGQTLSAEVKISTVGQQVQEIDGVLQKVSDKDHRLEVNEYLQVARKANIWAGGDVARVIRPYFKTECRADALWAIKHGTRIGKNMARMLKGKKPGRFKYPGLGYTASFGYMKGFTVLYGMPILGPLAWLNRFGFFLYFMPSRKRAFQLLLSVIKGEKENGHIVGEKVYSKPGMEAEFTTVRSPVPQWNTE